VADSVKQSPKPPKPDKHASLKQIETILLAVISILDCKQSGNSAKAKALGKALIDMEGAAIGLHNHMRDLGAHPGGVIASIDSIVAASCRLHAIQDTTFLSAGYALLDGMVLLVFVLMTLSDWPFDSLETFREGSAYTLVIGYVFTYIRLVVGDLESPFEYPPGYCRQCYDKGRRPEDAVDEPEKEKDGTLRRTSAWTWRQLAEEFQYGGSVKGTTMLTVVFGSQLKGLMTPRDEDAERRKSEGPAGQGNQGDGQDSSGGGQTGPPKTLWARVDFRARRSVRKWRLALRCVPLVLALLGFRLAVWFGAGVGGWLSSPQLLNTFTRLVVFVSAVVVRGLIQDYKEAERIPAELAAAFHGLTVSLRVWGRWVHSLDPCKADLDAPWLNLVPVRVSKLDKQLGQRLYALLGQVLTAVEAISSGGEEGSHGSCVQAMCAIGGLHEECFSAFLLTDQLMKEASVKSGYKVTLPDRHFEAIRSAVGRVHVIQSTCYILEAYTLMDLMVLLIFGVLTATEWRVDLTPNGVPAGLAYTLVISFLFVYLAWFVRNLENPFKYPREYLLRCYKKSRRVPRGLVEDHVYGGSVDMAPLTISYGRVLKELLGDSEIQPTDDDGFGAQLVTRASISLSALDDPASPPSLPTFRNDAPSVLHGDAAVTARVNELLSLFEPVQSGSDAPEDPRDRPPLEDWLKYESDGEEGTYILRRLRLVLQALTLYILLHNLYMYIYVHVEYILIVYFHILP
jgi:hypothetical protein